MREFIIPGENITVANNNPVSLVMVMPAAAPSVNLEILRCFVSQAANATSAQQRVEHTTQVAAFPTTAVSTNPVSLKRADPNASVIAGAATIAAGKSGINVGTEGAGTKTSIWAEAFNVLNGYLYVPTPAETMVYPAGSLSAYDLQFPAAPAALTNWNVGVTFREV
ncbi:MAG TPA: hypothetical protein VJ739_10790 [Gemmataceae bacterium]|nr:hypothetical protein [Gemmataceae bacterium]